MRDRKRVVAFGGGHGLSATLSALRTTGAETTAVVTVADDGGSSGRLRRQHAILPPGDLRMALAALCEPENPWAELLQHRFVEGDLRGHPVGNVLLTAIWERDGDPVQGLAALGSMIGSHGVVLPMCPVPLEISGEVRNTDGTVRTVEGQVALATAAGRVERIRLLPENPPATKQALRAVEEADLLVVGPGSWFTSVLPALAVPALLEAIISAPARRVLVLNLEAQVGETEGFSPVDHIDVMRDLAPELRFEHLVVDTAVAAEAVGLEQAAKALGAELSEAPLRREGAGAVHDHRALAGVFERLLARTP